LANAPLSSGLAPFWIFLYINDTDFGLLVTVANGTAQSIGPLSPTTPCGSALHFADLALNFGSVPPLKDSTTIGPPSWTAVGDVFNSSHPGTIALYAVGQNLVGISGGASMDVTYEQCGSPGITGDAAYTLYDPSNPEVRNFGTFTCNFNAYEVSGPAASGAVRVGSEPSLVANVAYLNSTERGVLNDSWGLTTWMTQLLLQNASGAPYVMSNVTCGPGGLNATNCRQSGSGWFGVLTAPNLRWLDVFSWQGGSGSWLFQNVPIYQGDSFLIESTVPSELSAGNLHLISNPNSMNIVITSAFYTGPPVP